MGQSDTESSIFVTFDVVRAFRARFEEGIAAANVAVTPAEARVLLSLDNYGPSRQAEIAERLAIGAMSVTGLVDRLEKAGFVRRLPDPDDRRANRVELTQASQPVLEQVDRLKAALRRRASHGIDPADYEIYSRVVRQVRANLTGPDPCGEDERDVPGPPEAHNA